MRLAPPKAPAAWIWVLGLFTIASFVEAAFLTQMMAFTPLYLPQLGIARADVVAWTGATAAIAAGLGIPFLPLWGALADRYARQPVIVRSFVAHVIAITLAILAGNVWVFVIARAITSLAFGNSGLMMATLSERVPARRMNLALSVMNSFNPVGAFVGPLLGGVVVDHWGFRALLTIDLLLLLLVVLGLSLGYRDTFKGKASGSLLGMAGGSLAILARSPRLRLLFPALFVLLIGWMLAGTYVPLAITTLYHGRDPGTVVGIIFGAGGLLTLILGPLLGALADRFGLWRVLLLSALGTVALWPLPALAHDLVSFSITWWLLDALMSGVFAISFGAISSSVDEAQRGRVMSFAFLPMNFAAVVGPALGAVVTQTSVMAVFPVAAGLTALGVGALEVARRQPTQPTQPLSPHSEAV